MFQKWGITKTSVRDAAESRCWRAPAQHFPSEPIFVARPGGEDEDDGVVLCVVLDAKRDASYLLCLDARSLEAVASAYLPGIVFDVHGEWLGSENFDD